MIWVHRPSALAAGEKIQEDLRSRRERVLTAFFLQQYSFHMPRSPERRRHRDRSHSIDRHKDDYRKDRHRK